MQARVGSARTSSMAPRPRTARALGLALGSSILLLGWARLTAAFVALLVLDLVSYASRLGG